MAEVERRGWNDVMEDIISEANDGPEYLFISVDIKHPCQILGNLQFLLSDKINPISNFGNVAVIMIDPKIEFLQFGSNLIML